MVDDTKALERAVEWLHRLGGCPSPPKHRQCEVRDVAKAHLWLGICPECIMAYLRRDEEDERPCA